MWAILLIVFAGLAIPGSILSITALIFPPLAFIVFLFLGIFAKSFMNQFLEAEGLTPALKRIPLADFVTSIAFLVLATLMIIPLFFWEMKELLYNNQLMIVIIQAAIGVTAIALYSSGLGQIKATREFSTPLTITTIAILSLWMILAILPLYSFWSLTFMLPAIALIQRGAFWLTAVGRIYPAPIPVATMGQYAQFNPPTGQYGPAPIMPLTGGAKFGYFILGFFLGLIGVLIAWGTTKDTPKSGPAIKFSAIGAGCMVGLSIVLTIIYFVVLVSVFSAY